MQLVSKQASKQASKEVSKITLATFDFNKHLTTKWLSHVALCNTGKCFPHFSYFAIFHFPKGS